MFLIKYFPATSVKPWELQKQRYIFGGEGNDDDEPCWGGGWGAYVLGKGEEVLSSVGERARVGFVSCTREICMWLFKKPFRFTTYEYKVSVHNSVGFAPSPRVTVTTLAGRPERGATVTVVVTNHTAVDVRCARPSRSASHGFLSPWAVSTETNLKSGVLKPSSSRGLGPSACLPPR